MRTFWPLKMWGSSICEFEMEEIIVSHDPLPFPLNLFTPTKTTVDQYMSVQPFESSILSEW